MSYPCVVAAFPFFPTDKNIVVLTCDANENNEENKTHSGVPLVYLPSVSPLDFLLNCDRVVPVETKYMYNRFLPASNLHGAPAHVTSFSFAPAPFTIEATPRQVLVNPLFEEPVVPVLEEVVAALPHTNNTTHPRQLLT